MAGGKIKAGGLAARTAFDRGKDRLFAFVQVTVLDGVAQLQQA